MGHRKLSSGYSALTKVQDELISTQRLVIQKQSELLKSYKGILKSKGIIKQKRFTEKEKSDLIQIVESAQKSKMSLLKELGINRGSYYC